MKHILIALLCIFSFSSLASAKTPTTVWSGYLMDKMCSKRMVGNQAKMIGHTKTCLTEDGCAGSGYGIMTDKKFIPFDTKGNEIAANFIKNYAKEKDFQVEVTGTLKKNKISVITLKEK